MKIGGIDVVDFIEQVPVLRLFARNLALSGGLAFIIQDFLIPLYASYIFPIVVALLVFATISLVYWNFGKIQDKSFAHVSFQLSVLSIILSLVIVSLSSVSKAFSSDADRGILGSNVKFIADLQDDTNVYKEDMASIGRDISKLQSDLSNLSAQISSQLLSEGSLSNEDFLNKISSRYGLEDWMICYIQNEYGLLITEPFCLSPISNFKRISLNDMIDTLADELSKDFQLNIDPNVKSELRISVSGVVEHKDLLNVERIMETNALVYAYSIGSISSDTVTYLLSIRGQVSDLEKLMNVNPLLTNQPSQENGIDLEYFYQAER